MAGSPEKPLAGGSTGNRQQTRRLWRCLIAGLPPLLAALFALQGALPVDPDQWREWLGAAGLVEHVGASGFGAVSPAYRIFLPPAWLSGSDPASWWGAPWLLLLAAVPFFAFRNDMDLQRLTLWAAAISLPPAVYWLRNHGITASMSYAAAAFALAALAGGPRFASAIWAAALALALYPAAGPFALAVGLVALARTSNPSRRRTLALHGLAAAGCAATPYLIAATDTALARTGGPRLGTPLDAFFFLGAGVIPSVVIAALLLSAIGFAAHVRLAGITVLLQWLIAAALLPLKTDWWAGYYMISNLGLCLAVLAAALSARPAWLLFVVLTGIAGVSIQADRSLWDLAPDAFWARHAARGESPHWTPRASWTTFAHQLEQLEATRLEGDAYLFSRWAREHREGALDRRKQLQIATFIGHQACRYNTEPGPCQFPARITDTLIVQDSLLVFRAVHAPDVRTPLATIRWLDCDALHSDATTGPVTLEALAWVHQTTLSLGVGMAWPPGQHCRAEAETSRGSLLLVAPSGEKPAAALEIPGHEPYLPVRF